MDPLNVMVYRHSAFYSPLLAGIGGGFFSRAGFDPSYTVMPPGRNVGDMLTSGEIQVSQASVSTSWALLEQGREPPFRIFATLNRRDGFLIAGRKPDPAFTWDKLRGNRFIFAHGGQPEAMLKYALHKRGIALDEVIGIDCGDPQSSMAAFAAGEGDYFHEQAPYPQQLEVEGKAHIIASVGEVIGPVAFSSLAAAPDWLEKPQARVFLEAFRAARTWAHTADPDDVASAVASFFPAIGRKALVGSITYYQQLGCWSGGLEIKHEEYEAILDVFLHSRLLTRRHLYAQVVSRAPST